MDTQQIMDGAGLKSLLTRVRQEIARVIIGQERVVDMALATILTGNHALIEGVPGIAKTLLVRTLGKVLGFPSQRIQFTPDLMPADIVGTNVFNMKQSDFTLIKGPVFTTFLLADEINRAPAKTQSALLQAMQERQVTIDRQTYALSPHFTVFATQNPIEYEGTYPLPEAQKDRFMFKIVMDYPGRDEELALAYRMRRETAPEAVLAGDDVKPVIDPEELDNVKRCIEGITLREELLAYIVDLVRSTRTHPGILVGGGPRATQALVASARCCAALAGRDFVTPDDIKDMSIPALSHRIILRPEFEIEGLSVGEVVQQVLKQVEVPR